MLYTMSRDRHLSFDDVFRSYQEGIHHSFELYLFNLMYLLQVVDYAKKDAERRSAKHLPSEEDERFSAKLFHNELTQSMHRLSELKTLFEHYDLGKGIDPDHPRSIYIEFAKTDDYKAYIFKDDPQTEDHIDILLKLYKACINNELFTEVMEDRYANWIDDKSLVVGTIKKTIKQLPVSAGFYEEYRPSDETTKEFGEALLRNVYERDEELLGHIEPTLKNWDAERVAVIDMILLKMALCELMIFPTIPTKVTLNEFVEISKMYSTEKSKDFINGILDRLMKKLNKEGKIQKEGRGLKE
ncbi:MAG: transcription antitermination factor NusB [Bacteroidota bacterium]